MKLFVLLSSPNLHIPTGKWFSSRFAMGASAHTLCMCKQSIEYGLMSVFNQNVLYFHGNWACLMFWNSSCQKFRTLNWDLSSAAPSNFKWASERLFTAIRIFCDAYLKGQDLRLPVSLSFQVVEEKGDSEIFWNSFSLHYLTVCLLEIKKVATVVSCDFRFSDDSMDCVDNERRPHFPQFSYSASGTA